MIVKHRENQNEKRCIKWAGDFGVLFLKYILSFVGLKTWGNFISSWLGYYKICNCSVICGTSAHRQRDSILGSNLDKDVLFLLLLCQMS